MKDGHAPEHRTGLPAKGALVCTWILCWVLGEAPPSLREDAVDGADGVEGQTLAPHERLPEILVVPREKTPTGAAAGENPRDAPVIAR